MSLLALAELVLDSGTLRFSHVGVAGNTAYYEARVLSFGELFREIPVVPDPPQASEVTIELANESGYFSALRSANSLYGRTLRILFGDPDRGEADFDTVFDGVITSWAFSGTTFSVSAVDRIALRFDEAVQLVLRTTLAPFANMPDRVPRHLVPLVYGTVSADGGALPAYAIDPAIGQANYRYVAGQGRLKSITAVYVYGVLKTVTTHYVVNYITGVGGDDLTVIDFLAAGGDPYTGEDGEVTFNCIGLTDDGLETGTAITNPARQFQAFLERNGFVAGDFDSDLVDFAATIYDNLSVDGAVALTGEPLVIWDAIEKFSSSFGIIPFSTRMGKLAFAAPQTDISVPADAPEIRERFEIGHDGFTIEAIQDRASALIASYRPNFVTGDFLSTVEREDSAQTTRYLRPIEVAVEMPFLRDETMTEAILDALLYYRREERHFIDCVARPDVYRQTEIGQILRVTHSLGLGTTGYHQVPTRVAGLGIRDSGGQIQARLRLVDLAAPPLAAIVAGATTIEARLSIAPMVLAATVAGRTTITASLSQNFYTTALQHLWLFNQGSGTQLTDSLGTRHGTLGGQGGSASNRPSWAGGGLTFDGVDDWVTINLFQNPSDSDWTVFIVFKSNANTRTILSQVGSLNRSDWLAHDSSNNLSSGLPAPPLSGPSVSTGTWYMGYIRRKQSTNLLQVNRRNTAGNSSTQVTDTVASISDGFHVLGVTSADFHDFSSGAFAFDGIMAMAGHYNAFLSDAEMTTVFNGAKAHLAGRSISL